MTSDTFLSLDEVNDDSKDDKLSKAALNNFMDDNADKYVKKEKKLSIDVDENKTTALEIVVEDQSIKEKKQNNYKHLKREVRYFVSSRLINDANLRRPIGNYNLDPTRMKLRLLYDNWFFSVVRNLALLCLLSLIVLEPAYKCELTEYGIPLSCVAIKDRAIQFDILFFMEVGSLGIFAASMIFLMFERGLKCVKDKMIMTVTFFVLSYTIVFYLGFKFSSFAKTSWHVRGILRVTFFLQKASVLDVLQDMFRTVVALFPTLVLYVACIGLFGLFGNILYGDLVGMEGFSDLWSAYKTSFVFATTANFPNIFLPSYGQSWSNCVFFVLGQIVFVYLFFNVILVNVYDSFKQSMTKKREEGIISRKIALNHAFEAMDIDDSGYIHASEFVEAMKFVFPNNTEEEIRVIFEDMDRDGDDSISRDEFNNVCYYLNVTIEKRGSTDKAVERRRNRTNFCHTFIYDFITSILCCGTALFFYIVEANDAPLEKGLNDPKTKLLFMAEVIYTGFMIFEVITKMASTMRKPGKWLIESLDANSKLDLFIVIVVLCCLLLGLYTGDYLTAVKRSVVYRILRIPRIFLRLSDKSKEIIHFTAQVIPTLGAPLITLCMWIYLGIIFTMFVFGGKMTLENYCLQDPLKFTNNIGFVYPNGNETWTDIPTCISSQPIVVQDYKLLHFNDAPHALISLFVLMIGNNWNDLMINTSELAGEMYAIVFMIFFLVTSIIILNIIIALFIDSYFMIQNKNKLNAKEEEKNANRQLPTVGLASKYLLVRNLALTYDELIHGVAETTSNKKNSDDDDSLEASSPIHRALERQAHKKTREANIALQNDLEAKKEAMRLQTIEMREAESTMRTKTREFEKKISQLELEKNSLQLQTEKLKAREQALEKQKEQADAFLHATEDEQKTLAEEAQKKFLLLQSKISEIEKRELEANNCILELKQKELEMNNDIDQKERDLITKMENDLIRKEEELTNKLTKEFEEKERKLRYEIKETEENMQFKWDELVRNEQQKEEGLIDDNNTNSNDIISISPVNIDNDVIVPLLSRQQTDCVDEKEAQDRIMVLPNTIEEDNNDNDDNKEEKVILSSSGNAEELLDTFVVSPEEENKNKNDNENTVPINENDDNENIILDNNNNHSNNTEDLLDAFEEKQDNVNNDNIHDEKMSSENVTMDKVDSKVEAMIVDEEDNKTTTTIESDEVRVSDESLVDDNVVDNENNNDLEMTPISSKKKKKDKK